MISATEFAPNGRWLATAANDGQVRLWELPSLRLAASLNAGLSIAYGLAFSPDGRRLFAGTEQGQIKIWELETFQELAAIELPGKQSVRGLGVAPGDDTLIALSLGAVTRVAAPRRD